MNVYHLKKKWKKRNGKKENILIKNLQNKINLLQYCTRKDI